jgi:Holliday junction resolvasome RuvABC ATP-dependent DNA helicase subunit
MNGKIKLFDGIIGQLAAKKKLEFFQDSYMSTRMVPNMIFVAPKGNGKTTLAREFAKGLVRFDEHGKIVFNDETNKPARKTFVEVNCSTLKNVKQFINGLIVQHVQDKDVTVLFDEASEIPKDVEMALLTILNPNAENRTTFSQDEYVCDFDFRRQTFLFATSEVHSVFHALLDRLERIDLEEYTASELAKIVQKGAKEVKFEDDVLMDVATVLRGNARAAQKMAGHIMSYLKGDLTFFKDDWEEICKIFNILPLGLNMLELNALRYLAGAPQGTSLTALSAKTGMSRESLQKDVELYLQKHGLMEIGTTGRQITAKGLDYLKALDNKPRVALPRRKRLAKA